MTDHEVLAAPDALLEISGLSVDYVAGRHRSTAVAGVSVRVDEGEFVSLVGESGSGKTTLVLSALGLLPPSAHVTAGSITYSGVEVTGWTDKKMTLVRGNYVGFIPQDPNTSLNPVKRIGQQVIDAVRFNTKPGPRARDKTHWRTAALDALRTAGLKDAERVFTQYPHELSGGMKQRALIAIALAGNPKIIVADEPTSALDVTVQKTILDHLARLGSELGIGVLLITHDLGVALDRSDRILVMKDGSIVESGTADRLRADPVDDYTRRLLDAAPARHATRLVPAGRSAAPPPGGAEAALVATGISKTYRSRRWRHTDVHVALDGVDLSVRAGTTHAIVGESGAGKSTLASIVAGFAGPDAGSVRAGGRELTSLSRAGWRDVRRDLQFVFQNPFTSLDPRFTVGRAIAEPLVAFGLAPSRVERAARVAELLDAVALDASFADRLPAQLSGGQRQRVAIARALALNPKILVLDEAVSALDVSVQAQILQLLVDLQAEFGLSYLFITHDLGVVRLIADDVTVMREGRVVESGAVAEVFAAPADPYTRALIDAIPGAGAAVVEEQELVIAR